MHLTQVEVYFRAIGVNCHCKPKGFKGGFIFPQGHVCISLGIQSLQAIRFQLKGTIGRSQRTIEITLFSERSTQIGICVNQIWLEFDSLVEIFDRRILKLPRFSGQFSVRVFCV